MQEDMTNLRSHAAWRWLKPDDGGRGGRDALLEGDMASLYVYVVCTLYVVRSGVMQANLVGRISIQARDTSTL